MKLPEKWCIKLTQENKTIVGQWFINQKITNSNYCDDYTMNIGSLKDIEVKLLYDLYSTIITL